MQYKEFGNSSAETVILLHGGGLSWWNYRETAALLKDDFHIILPILDGHAGSDRHFTTIENNAQEIISFINTHLNGSVFLIGGLSLGGQVLLEMLSQQKDLCRHALIESAMAVPSVLTNVLIRPAFSCADPTKMVCKTPVPAAAAQGRTVRRLLPRYLSGNKRRHDCIPQSQYCIRAQRYDKGKHCPHPDLLRPERNSRHPKICKVHP